MKIVYSNEKTEKQCTDLKTATKLFGGRKDLSISLMSRVNAIENAENLIDIIKMSNFHFHRLLDKGRKKLKGYYAIDVKSRKDAWRIILQPLDKDEHPYKDISIDQIAEVVKIIEITEVSRHYD